ncbi:MAG: hypothetical protein ACOCY7_04630 [Halodesulfurarchaeum sp.]
MTPPNSRKLDWIGTSNRVGDRTIEGDAVVSGREVRRARTTVETPEGRIVEDTHPHVYTLHLELELVDSGPRTFRDDRVRIDRDLPLDFDHVRVTGTITSLESTPEIDRSVDDPGTVADPEIPA